MNKFLNTQNLIYLTLFFTPLYLVRFKIVNLPTNFLELLIVATILFWFWENKNNSILKIKSFFTTHRFFSLAIFLILIGLFISSFLNNNLLKELGIVKSWFILPIFFGFIVFDKIINLSTFNKILSAILYSSLFISIISIFYFIFSNLTYDNRLRAFYLSPNHLAMIIVPGIIIGFWQLFQNKNNYLYKIIKLSPILIALFLTRSYANWAALFIIFSVIIFFIQNKSKKFIFISALLITSFLFFSQENNSDKFKSLINFSERSSLNSRIIIWKSAQKILSDNWLWGIGPGNFQEKYLAYQQYFPPYLEWAVPQPHNLILAFWLQAGLFGLIGFLSLIILWFLKIIKILIYQKDLNQKNLMLVIFSIIFYNLLVGLVDTPYWKNDLSLLFWTILFLGLSAIKKDSLLNRDSV